MSDLLIRLAAMKAADALLVTPATRTRYAVQLTTGQWAGLRRRWVAREHALLFDFVTSAEAYATLVLELAPRDYAVEAV